MTKHAIARVDRVDGLARQMLGMLLHFLDEHKSEVRSLAEMQALCSQFMMHFVGAVVYQALRDRPPSIKSESDMLNYNYKSFAGIKFKIQDAVANGVQDAMTAYSGHPMEYFCDIKVVPEVKVKKEA